MKRLLIALVMCGLLVGVVAADTLIIYPSVDGHAVRISANSTYSSIIGGVGTGAEYTGTTAYSRPYLLTNPETQTNMFHANRHSIRAYDTGAIPYDAVISSASENIYINAKQNGLGSFALVTVGGSLYNQTIVSGEDYRLIGTVEYASRVPYASIPTSGNLSIALNAAGIANVSKTGMTVIEQINDWEQNGTYAGGWAANTNSRVAVHSVRDSDPGKRPYLTITYTTPPPSLESLTNSSPSCNSLQFNYTVPAGVGEILVYRNNTQLANLMNSSIGVLWTGLPEDTDVTFSSRTCSIDGLVCNSTFVNMTARTGTCDATPPKSLGIAVGSKNCSAIDWSLTPPPDSDYAGFQVWWDNIRQSDQPNSTTSLVWTGLTELTSYTISTRTFDLKGNVNLSFANLTTDTTACGVVPVASFTANRTMVCSESDPVLFTDTSTNAPTSWRWDFGDGTNLTTQNATKVWNITGAFPVRLNATNSYGTSSTNKTIYVGMNFCNASSQRYVVCHAGEACTVTKIW